MRAAGSDVLSVAAHPGYSATNLQFAATPSRMERIGSLVPEPGRGPECRERRPADPLCGHGGHPRGSFVGPDGFQEMRGKPTLVTPTKAARDEQVAARLWDVSEELTGVRFAFDRPTAGVGSEA